MGKFRLAVAILTVGALLPIGGCAHYYKITDNQSHHEFYSVQLFPPNQLPASVELYNPETGERCVTTQYSVVPIDKEEYLANQPIK